MQGAYLISMAEESKGQANECVEELRGGENYFCFQRFAVEPFTARHYSKALIHLQHTRTQSAQSVSVLPLNGFECAYVYV